MQPILWLIFSDSTIWSLTDLTPQGKSSLESIPFSQLLTHPEDYNALTGSSLPRVKQLSLVLFIRPYLYLPSRSLCCNNTATIAVNSTNLDLRHLHSVDHRGYQYELEGSVFNSHFQSQLCNLSWQMAFSIFGLREVEKQHWPIHITCY